MLRVALRVGETDVDPGRIEEAEIVQTVETESDTLSVTLDARGAVIPPSGVRAEAWMDGAYMGGYVVGDLEWVTGEDGHTVRMIATGADLSASGLRTPATRARAGGLTLLALATQIAGDHGYEAVVHPDLAGVVLNHEDQIVESDLAYLVRVSDRYDADCRFSAGFVLLLPRTSETTVKGLPLERTLGAFQRLRIRFADRWDWQAFIARYYDYDLGRPIVVRVGSTRGPAYEVAGVQASRDVALAAARRARTRLSERAWVLSGTTPGDPALIPHVNLTTPGGRRPGGRPPVLAAPGGGASGKRQRRLPDRVPRHRALPPRGPRRARARIQGDVLTGRLHRSEPRLRPPSRTRRPRRGARPGARRGALSPPRHSSVAATALLGSRHSNPSTSRLAAVPGEHAAVYLRAFEDASGSAKRRSRPPESCAATTHIGPLRGRLDDKPSARLQARTAS